MVLYKIYINGTKIRTMKMWRVFCFIFCETVICEISLVIVMTNHKTSKIRRVSTSKIEKKNTCQVTTKYKVDILTKYSTL